MIFLKSEQEIDLIRQGSIILGKVHGILSKELKPGISTKELDILAEQYIKDCGALPSFKGINGYPFSICTSVNDEIVHGLPNKYKLKDGDIISIDCGVYYKGFHSDSAFTYPIGKVDEKVLDLIKVTEDSLNLAIENVRCGTRTGDIGNLIQTYIEKNGYSVIRELVGHGVGKSLHEEPEFPNYGKKGSGTKLKNGMVFALEPMVSMGSKAISYGKDGWTVKTLDKSLASHFEHTIALINGKTEVLTTYKYIDKKYTS